MTFYCLIQSHSLSVFFCNNCKSCYILELKMNINQIIKHTMPAWRWFQSCSLDWRHRQKTDFWMTSVSKSVNSSMCCGPARQVNRENQTPSCSLGCGCPWMHHTCPTFVAFSLCRLQLHHRVVFHFKWKIYEHRFLSEQEVKSFLPLFSRH